MKWILLLLIVFAGPSQAEGLYLTIGAGWNGHLFAEKDEWNDGGGTGAFIAASYQWDKQSWCKCRPSLNYAHISQWDVGPPFNNESEDWVDHVGIAATWAVFER